MKKWFNLFHTVGKSMLYGYHIIALTVTGGMWVKFGFHLLLFIPTVIVSCIHLYATNHWYNKHHGDDFQ